MIEYSYQDGTQIALDIDKSVPLSQIDSQFEQQRQKAGLPPAAVTQIENGPATESIFRRRA